MRRLLLWIQSGNSLPQVALLLAIGELSCDPKECWRLRARTARHPREEKRENEIRQVLNAGLRKNRTAYLTPHKKAAPRTRPKSGPQQEKKTHRSTQKERKSGPHSTRKPKWTSLRKKGEKTEKVDLVPQKTRRPLKSPSAPKKLCPRQIRFQRQDIDG